MSHLVQHQKFSNDREDKIANAVRKIGAIYKSGGTARASQFGYRRVPYALIKAPWCPQGMLLVAENFKNLLRLVATRDALIDEHLSEWAPSTRRVVEQRQRYLDAAYEEYGAICKDQLRAQIGGALKIEESGNLEAKRLRLLQAVLIANSCYDEAAAELARVVKEKRAIIERSWLEHDARQNYRD